MGAIGKIGAKIRPALQAAKRKAYLAIPPSVSMALYYAGAKLSNLPLWRRNQNHHNPNVDNMYGAMEASAIWIGYEVAKESMIKTGIEPKKASLALFSTAAGGVLGAKALYFAQFNEQITDLTNFLMCDGGTWYGGAAGGLTALYLYARSAKLSFVQLLDSLTPAALIGLGIGRIGCWSAGCCPGEMFGLHTEPISAAFNIITGLWLTRTANSPAFKGKTFLLGISLYSAFRFVIECFRHEPVVALGLTLSQIISVGVGTTAAALYARFSRRAKTPEAVIPEKPKEAVQTPAQKFKHRLLEFLIFIPALWLFKPVVAIIIGAVNLVRAVRAGVQWRRAKKNKINNLV
jgi:phosphatidylglycerol:prolipoprotein diacylglycerol transferase